jgi:hypothetical protein
MQQAVRDTLIAFLAATAQAQAEATKAAQRAGIEHAKQREGRTYIGRKPSYTRDQFNKVRAMLGQEAVRIAQIARETGLTWDYLPDKGRPCGCFGCLGLIIPQRETADNIWVTIIQFGAAVRKRSGLSSPRLAELAEAST